MDSFWYLCALALVTSELPKPAWCTGPAFEAAVRRVCIERELIYPYEDTPDLPTARIKDDQLEDQPRFESVTRFMSPECLARDYAVASGYRQYLTDRQQFHRTGDKAWHVLQDAIVEQDRRIDLYNRLIDARNYINAGHAGPAFDSCECCDDFEPARVTRIWLGKLRDLLEPGAFEQGLLPPPIPTCRLARVR